MIYGIGIDIVEIERFNSPEKVEKFSKRILSSQEKNIYHSLDNKNKHVYISKQFALKEAISKALGTGIRGGVNFKEKSLKAVKREILEELDIKINLNQILQGGLAMLVGWLFKTVNDLQQEVATLKAQVQAYQDSIAGFNQNLIVIEEVIREILFKVGG